MIMSVIDPRDERFLIFVREAEGVGSRDAPIPERIDRLAGAARAVAEAVEARSPPPSVARWTIDLAGWALSPDPVGLEPWALDALRHLRRDRVRARNVALGVVDWVLGQLRARVTDLRGSWQALYDVGLGYPIDPAARVEHPAEASAKVTVWSYALLRAVVAQHARGLSSPPTTLEQAARAGRRPPRR